MEFALHWHDAFLFLWFAFTLAISGFKNYKHALLSNIAATASFTVYALGIHEPVAASMTAIAAGSGIIQLLIPISSEKKYVVIRNTIAVVMAVAACVMLYQKPADILPCIATFVTRVGEAQQSSKIIKMSILVATTIWAIFGLMAGLYLMSAMRGVIIAVFLRKLFKESHTAV